MHTAERLEQRLKKLDHDLIGATGPAAEDIRYEIKVIKAAHRAIINGDKLHELQPELRAATRAAEEAGAKVEQAQTLVDEAKNQAEVNSSQDRFRLLLMITRAERKRDRARADAKAANTVLEALNKQVQELKDLISGDSEAADDYECP